MQVPASRFPFWHIRVQAGAKDAKVRGIKKLYMHVQYVWLEWLYMGRQGASNQWYGNLSAFLAPSVEWVTTDCWHHTWYAYTCMRLRHKISISLDKLNDPVLFWSGANFNVQCSKQCSPLTSTVVPTVALRTVTCTGSWFEWSSILTSPTADWQCRKGSREVTMLCTLQWCRRNSFSYWV